MITENLKNFIKDECGNVEQINADTTLEEDLGISGDDAIEFITKFSVVFSVDISSFSIEKYFRPEGSSLKRLFSFGLIKGKEKNREQMTLGKLQDAVNKGKLI